MRLAPGLFLAIVSLAGAQAPTEGAEQRTNAAFNPRRQITVAGVVTGKVKGTSPGLAESMAILVRSKRGGVYSVDLGPTWFVRNQPIAMKVGDRVRVTGTPIVINGRERVLLPSRVVKGRTVMSLRDGAGRPRWQALRPGRVVVTSNQREIAGTVASTATYNVNGVPYGGYEVQTPTGNVSVALAPTWYLRNQSFTLGVGDRITVVGPRIVQQGGLFTVADAVFFGPNHLLLRNNGVGVWNAFGNYR